MEEEDLTIIPDDLQDTTDAVKELFKWIDARKEAGYSPLQIASLLVMIGSSIACANLCQERFLAFMSDCATDGMRHWEMTAQEFAKEKK